MLQHPDLLMKSLRELQLKIAFHEQRLASLWRGGERDLTRRDVTILRSQLAALLGTDASGEFA